MNRAELEPNPDGPHRRKRSVAGLRGRPTNHGVKHPFNHFLTTSETTPTTANSQEPTACIIIINNNNNNDDDDKDDDNQDRPVCIRLES